MVKKSAHLPACPQMPHDLLQELLMVSLRPMAVPHLELTIPNIMLNILSIIASN